MRTTPLAARHPARATAAGAPLTVSVVIPAYNEADMIQRCLDAAADQSMPAHEILVIDNRSTDDTAAIVERFVDAHPGSGVRLLSQHRMQGLVPTRNLGFAVATGDVLGRIDADTVIDRDWVARVAGAFADPSVGGVSGPVSYYDLPFVGGMRLSDDVARRTLRFLGRDYPFLFGSNMALRASAWHAVESSACLDHADILHEDIDLSVHLHEAGIAVAYVPRMTAAISARRLSTAPDAFRSYTRRFERTYQVHDVHRWYLSAPQRLLQGVYWWARVLRAVAPAPRAAVAA
ncbi:glycosyltransferase [Microbacterium sp. RD1]|uniref:glycosyltransferase n=1 Tax=Microbacterium sp. RD1 TaxID=3457313 RepID=UPI003FA5B635